MPPSFGDSDVADSDLADTNDATMDLGDVKNAPWEPKILFDLKLDSASRKILNLYTDIPIQLKGIEGKIFVQFGKNELITENGDQILYVNTGSPVVYADGVGLMDVGTGRVINYQEEMFMVF